jgi:hypothetical protein
MNQQHPPQKDGFYDRICNILDAAQIGVVRTVNTAQVLSHWLIGREIVEEEQAGHQRAEYGDSLLKTLAQKLSNDYGKGFSYANLKLMRQFYLSFPHLLTPDQKGYALRSLFPNAEILTFSSSDSWQSGQLHPNLSWTHYRIIMRVENLQARAFYEIEALKNNWSSRELERQINSLLFERLAKSTDQQGLMELCYQLLHDCAPPRCQRQNFN